MVARQLFLNFDKELFSSFGAHLARKQQSEHNVPFAFDTFHTHCKTNASLNSSVELDMSAENPSNLKSWPFYKIIWMTFAFIPKKADV